MRYTFLERSEATVQEPATIDVLYLFGCFVMWRKYGDERCHQEIVLAAESSEEAVRTAALAFLGEYSRAAKEPSHASCSGSHICQS